MTNNPLIKKLIFVSALALALPVDSFGMGAKNPNVQGPFGADGVCPSFKPVYSDVEIIFGNRGLSVVNSFFETFFGEGVFEITQFRTIKVRSKQFKIIAKSNRGDLISDIYADRVVRIGQDLENEELRLTHQSAFCNGGRIYENQIVYERDKKFSIQDLEYWTEGDTFHFRLYQNKRLVADVIAR